MLKIKRNTFETNSSSVHSIGIVDGSNSITKGMQLPFDKNNCIKIISTDDLSFQWGFSVLDTPYEKLCYAIASYGYDKFDRVLSELREINANASILLPSSEYDSYNSEDSYYYGDIDHQSDGTLQNYLEETDSSISEFIMDPNIIVVIDNDNEDNTVLSVFPRNVKKWY